MTTRQAALAVAVVSLLAATLGVYYLVHKPFGLPQALAFVQSLANLAVAAGLVVLGGALGRRLLASWLGAASATLPAGEKVVIEVALGWGAIGLGMLALGLLRLD